MHMYHGNSYPIQCTRAYHECLHRPRRTEYVGLGSVDLLRERPRTRFQASMRWNSSSSKVVFRRLGRPQRPPAGRGKSAAAPSWPVSATIACLGIAVAAVPTASVQGRYLMRRMRIAQPLADPNSITFSSASCHGALFSSPMQSPETSPTPSCVAFWICYTTTWILSTGYALLSTVLNLRLARFCRQMHSGPASSACFIEWRVVQTAMNLRGNMGSLLTVLQSTVLCMLVLLLPALTGATSLFLDGDRQTSQFPTRDTPQRSQVQAQPSQYKASSKATGVGEGFLVRSRSQRAKEANHLVGSWLGMKIVLHPTGFLTQTRLGQMKKDSAMAKLPTQEQDGT